MKRTSTLPYFPIDSGKALAQCAGLPLDEVGAMYMLMLYYWESECNLPTKEWLTRRLHLKGKQSELLGQVIDEFFPDGIHEYLDHCWDNAMNTSRQNAENAKKGHERQKAKKKEPEEIPKSEIDDADF